MAERHDRGVTGGRQHHRPDRRAAPEPLAARAKDPPGQAQVGSSPQSRTRMAREPPTPDRRSPAGRRPPLPPSPPARPAPRCARTTGSGGRPATPGSATSRRPRSAGSAARRARGCSRSPRCRDGSPDRAGYGRPRFAASACQDEGVAARRRPCSTDDLASCRGPAAPRSWRTISMMCP